MAADKSWARDLAAAIRERVDSHADDQLDRTEVAEVVKITPDILIRPAGGDVLYDEDDIVWGIDPTALEIGDTVLLSRDTTDTPVVTSILDGNDPDPTFHPAGKALSAKVSALHARVRFWGEPVATLTDLNLTTTDADGTVRLVRSADELYRWNEATATWVSLGGSGSSTFAALTDVNLTGLANGDLIKYDSGTSKWINFVSPYAPLASPTFTGVPAAPTAAPGTNTTQLATTAFVAAATPSVSFVTLSRWGME